MSLGKIKVLRYETVLEMLEDGPVSNDELLENLAEQYPNKHINEVLNKMLEKGYVNWDNSKTWKTKDLFYKEL